MFGNKKKIKELEFQIKDLEWRIMNPSQYKVGDVDKKLGKCFEVKFLPSDYFHTSLGWFKRADCFYIAKFIKGNEINTVFQS